MARKKKTRKTARQAFNPNPFGSLKGFAASSGEKTPVLPKKPAKPVAVYGSFEEEMDLLGVKPLDKDQEHDSDDLAVEDDVAEHMGAVAEQSEDDLFLSAMKGLNVEFKDNYESDESDGQGRAIPRRMKQVRQGRLRPESTLDLHGCIKSEVEPKLKNFLANAQKLGMQTLLVITGRGLHSEGGEPVVRRETESYLGRCSAVVAEWGRAPKEYGGAGAIFIFLKKR